MENEASLLETPDQDKKRKRQDMDVEQHKKLKLEGSELEPFVNNEYEENEDDEGQEFNHQLDLEQEINSNPEQAMEEDENQEHLEQSHYMDTQQTHPQPTENEAQPEMLEVQETNIPNGNPNVQEDSSSHPPLFANSPETPQPPAEPSSSTRTPTQGTPSNSSQPKDQPKRPEAKKIDQELERAFHYFDKNRVGYIKSDDLEHLFHCIGQYFSKRTIRDMVNRVCDASKQTHAPHSSYSHSRCFYYKAVLEK
uniref:EF-hand domain-containing protein n=1 Tax=Arcella intermedia TaxID=1963864 RepID=A0A6B2LAJ8_9EUKA